jgi:hypothetical protein
LFGKLLKLWEMLGAGGASCPCGESVDKEGSALWCSFYKHNENRAKASASGYYFKENFICSASVSSFEGS